MPDNVAASAVNGSFAVGHVGDGGQVAYYAAPRPPVSLPHQVGALPQRAGCFQHRAAVEELEQALADCGAAVLSGTGGIGKTQLAAHHARRLWQHGQLDLLVWITAVSREAIIAAYAQAAAEVLGADATDPERAAAAFLAWLEPKRPAADDSCRWLVVLDDVADPADLRGLRPPPSPHGRTVVTTQRRDAALSGDQCRNVEVDLYSENEAIAYLNTALAAHGRRESHDEIAALANDLNYLPLALAQATAYLVDVGLDCGTYRQNLTDCAGTLAEMLPDTPWLPDDQATTVAAAWALSIDRANALRPAGLARPMLRLAAVLDPNGIPAAVLTSQPALHHLAAHRTGAAVTNPQQIGQVTAVEAIGALRTLHRLSLVDHDPGSSHQTVRVHPLIQRAVRDALAARERDLLARTAANALVATWPDIERDSALAQVLRANTDTLRRTAQAALWQPNAHAALFRAGQSFGDAGLITAAITYYQQLNATATRYLSHDHPNTLTIRGNLARWAGIRDPAGTANAFTELVRDQKRVLGPNHPDTLKSRYWEAYWSTEVGARARATAILQELHSDQTRVLGPDHPDTLTTRYELIYCTIEFVMWSNDVAHVQARAHGWAAMHELLKDRQRVLGPDHPDTLATRYALARWQAWCGDLGGIGKALPILQEILADQTRVLGRGHPDTLTTRFDFLFFRSLRYLMDPKALAEAQAAMKQLLDDTSRALGPDHRLTFLIRRHLLDFLRVPRDSTDRATAYAELWQDQVRVFGPDHPDSQSTRFNMQRELQSNSTNPSASE